MEILKKLRLYLFVISIIGFGNSLYSQTFKVTGTITDSLGTTPLYGATITLKIAGDTSRSIVTGTSTDSLGNFTITNVAPGTYRMKVMYPGFKLGGQRISITNSDLSLGKIQLNPDPKVLKEAIVMEKQIRISQNGDTISFNAAAFKTNPDATAEDLLIKMPGVTNDGGVMKVHGEEVKQVLVDGKPFLGDDPNAALKNVPANMVDQVQVYDKMSDQSSFSGFDDGQSKKTINIVTKNFNGKFGKVYAGYGTDDRYSVGETVNFFNGARRFTVLGMSNNINIQNFTTSDMFGTMGGGKGMGGRGRGGYSGQGGSVSGITTTHAFGFNYSDEWGKKVKVSGSYFFNYGDNNNNTTLSRNYFTTTDSTLFYNESNTVSTRNINHRFNFKLEYTIDSMNVILFTPKFTSQFTDYTKQLDGGNFSSPEVQQTLTSTNNSSLNQGFTFSSGLTYRHRFIKPKRTFTVDLNGSYTPRIGSGVYYSNNEYSNDTTLIDQHSSLVTAAYSGSTSFSWTEPVGTKGQFLFNYTPSISNNQQDKKTNNFNSIDNSYSTLDSVLSNNYDNIYFTHRAGASYRFQETKYSIIVGNDFQYSTLTGNQKFPSSNTIEKTFQNVLPNAIFNYKFSSGKNLKVVYRTSIVAPSITQLQEVIDNTNPLQLKTGNPTLVQDYEHTLISHYGKTNFEKATGFFAFFYLSLTSNYIGNSTFIAESDTTVNGVFLNRGSQISKPINLSGYKSGRGFLTYTFAVTPIKCNLSLNGMVGYSTTPSIINSISNAADNLNVGPGVTLSSNMSEKLDFTLSYSGNYNIIKNTVQTQADNNYFSHTASFRLNWIFYKGFVFNTTLDQTYYNGLGQAYNSSYLLWSAYVGYKFLKDQSLEAKISAFDIMKQNTSISRTVYDTYIEDSRTNTLEQYFMFTLTYNIKKMKGPGNPPNPTGPPMDRPNPGSGGPPHN